MRIALALALLASMTTEAAACHRFSIWHYSWPQRCGSQSLAERSLRPRAARVALRPALARTVASTQPPAPVAMSEEAPPEAIEALRLKLDAMMLQRASQIPPPVRGDARAY
jgi:hypothetical protein